MNGPKNGVLRWMGVARLRPPRARDGVLGAPTPPVPSPDVAESEVGSDDLLGPGGSAEVTHLVTTAIRATATGILITDRQGVIRWVNPAFTQMTGYSLEEAVGRTPRFLRSGKQPEAFYKHMWNTILDGRVWHGELYNRHKDGHLYAEEQTIVPVLNREGALTHFIGIKQDITWRKQYEEKLERRNAELAVMASAVGAITSSLEVEGVLRSIVEAIGLLLPHALGATVQMVDASGRLVTRAASGGLGPRRAPTEFAPGWGAAGLAFRDRRIVNVADVREDRRYQQVGPPPAYLSLLAVPIGSGGLALGTLCVAGKEREAFQQHEENLLSLFAGSSAIAIGHASEYEGRVQAEREIKRYSEQLEDMVEQRTADLRAAQGKLLEQQRLEQEVALAAQVQASILPRRTPDLPGYEFAGVALAARYLSGDLYDWIGLGPEHCDLALADIAGKGIPAAMMTSSARALLRDSAARRSPPGATLSDLNRSLYDELAQAGVIITVVAAHLNARTAAVDYASAGHTEVLWYQAAGKACERLPATGPPIGVKADSLLEERRVFLCPGDVLLFYSDGATEAENEKGEFFGVDRLVALLKRGASLSATSLAQSVVQAVDAFSPGMRSDDLTLIVVKALPRTVPFRCPGEFGHMERPMELIRVLGRPYGADFAYDLELAVSEILSNVIEHAYRGCQGELRGQVRLEADRVEVDLFDDGLPFDLSKVPARPAGQLADRGYGVHIARQLSDEIAYSPGTPAGNHWHLVKRRPGGGLGP